MPREAEMEMSTSSWMAVTASATWSSSCWVGPFTAATMQNSDAPIFSDCFAASTSSLMSRVTERTGDSNRPDWEQKWQSSGQPPVFREMMPSRETSTPQCLMRTWCARSSSSGRRSSSMLRIWTSSSLFRPSPFSRAFSRAISRMSVIAALQSWWFTSQVDVSVDRP